MDELIDDETEISRPAKRGRKKKGDIDLSVIEQTATARIQAQITELVLEGRPVPEELRMQLAFAVLETITDQDKKLRGLLAITKTFKSAESGMSDEEILERTPKSILQLIARQKGNNMNRFLSEMER